MRYQGSYEGYLDFLDTLDKAMERSAGTKDHDCKEHAVLYESEGALGHGWECGKCGAFLQAG